MHTAAPVLRGGHAIRRERGSWRLRQRRKPSAASLAWRLFERDSLGALSGGLCESESRLHLPVAIVDAERRARAPLPGFDAKPHALRLAAPLTEDSHRLAIDAARP